MRKFNITVNDKDCYANWDFPTLGEWMQFLADRIAFDVPPPREYVYKIFETINFEPVEVLTITLNKKA